MAKKRYYVVWRGNKTGVFNSWEECKEQVERCDNAIYKGFPTLQEAEEAFAAETPHFRKISSSISPDKPTYKAIAVDAACSGNPGNMEYRGVWIDTGEELFRSKIYPIATNNIGEFLALVHILALSEKKAWNFDIYSDSYNAIVWVKNAKCKTHLELNEETKEVFDIIKRAENWLKNHQSTNRIIKWETSQWGEIPADFGRK